MFNTPNLGNFSPYELTYGRKPGPLLNLDSNPDIKISGTFRVCYELLNKRLKYLHDIFLNFKSKRLAFINKDRAFFQYKGRDLVYITSPLTCQLWTASCKVTIKYVGPVVIYKIIDPHNYLLMTLDGKILRGLFEHKRLKPTNIRTRSCSKLVISVTEHLVEAVDKLSTTAVVFFRSERILKCKCLYWA